MDPVRVASAVWAGALTPDAIHALHMLSSAEFILPNLVFLRVVRDHMEGRRRRECHFIF